MHIDCLDSEIPLWRNVLGVQLQARVRDRGARGSDNELQMETAAHLKPTYRFHHDGDVKKHEVLHCVSTHKNADIGADFLPRNKNASTDTPLQMQSGMSSNK